MNGDFRFMNYEDITCVNWRVKSLRYHALKNGLDKLRNFSTVLDDEDCYLYGSHIKCGMINY